MPTPFVSYIFPPFCLLFFLSSSSIVSSWLSVIGSFLGPSQKPFISLSNVTLKLTKVSYCSWEAESQNQQRLSLSSFCVLILQLSCHCHFFNRWGNWFSKISNALLSTIHVHLFLTRQLYLSSLLASGWVMTSSCQWIAVVTMCYLQPKVLDGVGLLLLALSSSLPKIQRRTPGLLEKAKKS